MNRRTFLRGLAGLTATTAVSSALPARAGARRRPPNILYILADDHGYGHLGCYGQTDILTPRLDEMASAGMRFTDHYAGSALCAPSRCVLITGLHTGHCFIRDNKALPVEGNVPIPADSQTLGKLLKQAGYTTACIGKWGLGYPGSEGDPNKQGFDYFFGYNCQRQAHSYYPEHLWRNDEKVILKGNAGGQQNEYSHDLLTAEALAFVRGQREGPFFLYLPYTIPHAKFQVPDFGVYADKPWTDTQKAIAAMISRMDNDIGRILDLIKELDIDRNTVVMFASDNGSAGGDLLGKFRGAGSFRGQKGTLYEGGLRVPMIARWPGRIAPGSVSNHVSGFQDIMPTFAELAGVSLAKPADGISLVPTLLGRDDQQQHEYLYWELKTLRAVRLGGWKAVRARKGMELFDLRSDLAEKHDLAAEHQDIVERMQTIIETAHRSSPFFDWEYTEPRPDAGASGGSAQMET